MLFLFIPISFLWFTALVTNIFVLGNTGMQSFQNWISKQNVFDSIYCSNFYFYHASDIWIDFNLQFRDDDMIGLLLFVIDERADKALGRTISKKT